MASQSGSGSPGRRVSGGSGGSGGSGDSAAPQRSVEASRRGNRNSEDAPRTIGDNSIGGLSGVAFLTVAEVASLMRVSKMTVYRLLHSGELAGVRVGRSFRVPESAVHAYLRDAFNDTA
ncbi:MAG: helix-turn-helix domain-containing protein [Geodermatophilaceae bacterium]